MECCYRFANFADCFYHFNLIDLTILSFRWYNIFYTLLCFSSRYGSVWSGYESNGTSSNKGTHKGHQDPSQQQPQQQQQEETSKDTSEQEKEKKASSGFGDPEMDPSELAMLGIDPSDFAGFGN